MATIARFAAALTLTILLSCGGRGVITPDDDGGSNPPPDNGSAEQLCVDTINMYRGMVNLPPYQRWTAQESCVDGQAQADQASGTPHSAFGHCGESAQNECPGWSGTPSSIIQPCLAQMWAEGPGTDFSTHGHYINMTSTTYTMVACGYYTTSAGSVWAAQDFR